MFRSLVLLLCAVLVLVGCDSSADRDKATDVDPDVVSGASQPEASGDERIVFNSDGMNLLLEELASTGNVIWAIDFLDSNTLIFTERHQGVKLLQLDSGEVSAIAGGPEIMITDSGGLFDVLVDPDFARNNFIYFSYVKPLGEESALAIARSRLQGDVLVDTLDLFVANNPSTDHAHWGSRVVMDEDRYLFFTSGDRHIPDNAQRLNSHGGKVLRIKADGTVPADNPFVGQADVAPEIWSYGHRNPQGLAIQPGTGLLFEQEHGPTGGDEINIVYKARNYGWPVITYGEDIWGGQLPEGVARDGMEQPLRYFKPGIAPSGMCFYAGDRLSAWSGSLFNSTLRGHVTRLQLGADNLVLAEERLVANWGERIRDIAQGADGYLYLATESGKLARVRLDDE